MLYWGEKTFCCILVCVHLFLPLNGEHLESPGPIYLQILVEPRGVLETNDTNFKCKCLRSTMNSVPLRRIEKIQIWPPGNGCPTKEIMTPLCQVPTANRSRHFVPQKRQSKKIISTHNSPWSEFLFYETVL
uniref:Chemokine interleukin-8-like domain-containing protein n=1 Tax=Catagonus wagneri TaxID=51154 RepID=A0A8C3WTW5_9CETA